MLAENCTTEYQLRVIAFREALQRAISERDQAVIMREEATARAMHPESPAFREWLSLFIEVSAVRFMVTS